MGSRKWWGLLAMMALLPSVAVAHTWYVFDADTDACVTSKVLAAQEGIPSLAHPKSFLEWAHNKPWFEGYQPSKKSSGLSIFYKKNGEFSYWPGNDKKGCESYVKILQHYHQAPLSIQPNFPRGDANVAPKRTMPDNCTTPKAHADMRQALAEIDRQNTGKWMTYKKTSNTHNLSPASPNTLTCLVGYTIRRHGINLFADSRITVRMLSHGRGYSATMP